MINFSIDDLQLTGLFGCLDLSADGTKISTNFGARDFVGRVPEGDGGTRSDTHRGTPLVNGSGVQRSSAVGSHSMYGLIA